MRGDAGLTGIVSIHDVMPRTLGAVRGLLDWLRQLEVAPVTLLVVPGVEWGPAELEELKRWEASGCELAGHGWVHETVPRGLYHRLHAAVISRNVAEHLALDAAGIEALIERCHAWFGDHGFRAPELYVPPAWAMGGIGAARVRNLPFRRYEYMRGVLEADTGKLEQWPMVGFEADRWWRKAGVRMWNRLNLHAAERGTGVLRIGIHPRDRDLLLAPEMEGLLRRCRRFRGYGSGSS
ncbi:MAG: DUF2334 domain-containing protein [Akkermansiaceae bacterium]|nr:DUF2334 domain-containing protein [Akkermansiaceae bacterium]NNM29290.1 DUF2334 domain-containing protein [Akkermansiaceae bacterium]